MPKLFFDVEDGEAIFVIGILDSFYTEALKEVELAKKRTDEDAKDDAALWSGRAEKYKKMIDELEEYIEIEANKVWVFVKNPESKVSPKNKLSYTALPCPNCGSTNTTGHGYRKNGNMTIPVRWCRNCGKKYTNKENTLFKMKFPKEIIETSMKLVKEGMSTRNVTKFIFEKYGVKVSNASISIWNRSEKLKSFGIKNSCDSIKRNILRSYRKDLMRSG